MKNLLADMTFRLFAGRRRHKQGSRPVMGSVLGIALSMIPLVVVLFLSDAMIRGITSRYIESGSFHLQIRSYSSLSLEQWQDNLALIQGVEGLRLGALEHGGMGFAYKGKRDCPVSVRGIQKDLYFRDEGFRRYVKLLDGHFDLEEPRSIVLGRETAKKLDVRVGDSIRILTGKTLSSGKYIPKISRFTVKGIFTTGYQDLDRLWVFIAFDRALKILQDRDSSTRIMIKSHEPYGDLNAFGLELRSALNPGRWGVYTWPSMNRSQQSNYQSTRVLLVLIMALIVLVAVMNISSSMVMLVMENEQEIGILKSMGISNSFLGWQYALTAGLAGGSGSLGGLVLGSLIAVRFNQLINFLEFLTNGVLGLFYQVSGRVNPGQVALLNKEYYLDDFSITLDFGILTLIFFLTLILSVAAAWLPVRKIARISPLDILRKH